MPLHKNIRSADPRTRNPEAYTAPAQPAAEDQVAQLLAALVTATRPRRVLELGTAFGHTSLAIATALKANGVGHLDTLDVNTTRLAEARRRLHGLPATVFEASYLDWVPPAGARYDMAFFDADREHRDREYATFKPFLNAHAILAFHDAGEQHKGNASIYRVPLPLVYIPCPRGLVLASEPGG